MVVRSWIILDLDNGKKVRYVRDIKYAYGDTISDLPADSTSEYYSYDNGTFHDQGDTAGQISTDLNSILTSVAQGDSRILFPESTGDTIILTRRNWDTYAGDTAGEPAYNHFIVYSDHITDIFVEETQAPTTVAIG